jgi:hypothetical protein
VELVEVDALDAEAAQGVVALATDVLGAQVGAGDAVVLVLPPSRTW